MQKNGDVIPIDPRKRRFEKEIEKIDRALLELGFGLPYAAMVGRVLAYDLVYEHTFPTFAPQVLAHALNGNHRYALEPLSTFGHNAVDAALASRLAWKVEGIDHAITDPEGLVRMLKHVNLKVV